MKIIRRILKWLGVLIGIWIAAGIVMFGWGVYREPIAKAQALEFCAKVKAGQSPDSIAELAIASGAEARLVKWIPEAEATQVMNVTYVGMPPFSRHICTVKANSKVISAEYLYLD